VKINKKTKFGLFLSHVVPGVARPMRVLWNEVVGFVFLVLGVVFISAAVRAYRAIPEGEVTTFKVAVLIPLPAMMIYFGVTSFLRARRISRS